MESREASLPLAELDPYACNLRLLGICTATSAELAAVFRLLPDQVRVFAIPTDAGPLAQEGASVGDAPALTRAVLEEQILVLRVSGDRGHSAGRIGSAMRAATGALRYGGHADLAESTGRAGAVALSESEPAVLVAAIDEALRSLMSETAVLAGKDAEDVASTPAQPARAVNRSLRVDESRIDALVDMAGELLVVKNGFAHLAKRAESEAGGHDLARAVRDQNEALERLAGVLHGAVLQLRMVPLAQVFRSFPRFVRDLSQQLGKHVTLVTHGETTEADKTIVDLLFEPLMHLVRNALDHGIEAPGQRRVAGKPEAATLTLQAARRADRLVVEVIDDGRGIDPAVIRLKAGEKRLLPEDELAALSDEQAVDLIFAAGFSTAAKISDVSGRGVGMDVVRAAIERIGGRASASSRVGAGTTADVVIITPETMKLLIDEGLAAGGSEHNIAKSVVGVAVRAGARKPAIATADDVRNALIAAKSVAYTDPSTGAASGVHFVQLLERFGIVDAVKAKAKLGDGGPVAEFVARGEAEIAIQQLCEHMLVPGVDVVGPLPDELNKTTVFTAGVTRSAAAPNEGAALIKLLLAPHVRAAMPSHGLTPV